MNANPRILLVEHLDAVGASVTDLRARAQVLRNLGAEVRMLTLPSEADHDLQHGTSERQLNDIQRLDEARGGEAVRGAAEEWRADRIVWVSAATGGGEPARSLGTTRPPIGGLRAGVPCVRPGRWPRSRPGSRRGMPA